MMGRWALRGLVVGTWGSVAVAAFRWLPQHALDVGRWPRGASLASRSAASEPPPACAPSAEELAFVERCGGYAFAAYDERSPRGTTRRPAPCLWPIRGAADAFVDDAETRATQGCFNCTSTLECLSDHKGVEKEASTFRELEER